MFPTYSLNAVVMPRASCIQSKGSLVKLGALRSGNSRCGAAHIFDSKSCSCYSSACAGSARLVDSYSNTGWHQEGKGRFRCGLLRHGGELIVNASLCLLGPLVWSRNPTVLCQSSAVTMPCLVWEHASSSRRSPSVRVRLCRSCGWRTVLCIIWNSRHSNDASE